jgi:hypothetical protein
MEQSSINENKISPSNEIIEICMNDIILEEDFKKTLMCKLKTLVWKLKKAKMKRRKVNKCRNPTLKECEDDIYTLEMRTWESHRTPKDLEFDCKGQNTLP